MRNGLFSLRGHAQSRKSLLSRASWTLILTLAWTSLAALEASGHPVRHAEESLVDPASALRETVRELNARVAAKKPRFDRMPREGDLHYECQALPALPTTLLCLFNMRLLMNAALARASYYSENEKRVLSDSEMLEEVKTSRALGFNLSAPMLEDFQSRRESAREFASTRPSSGALEAIGPAESVFLQTENRFEEDFALPFTSSYPSGYLLTAAADDDLESLLGHEIQHAQFFHDATFRTTVERYWRDATTSADKDTFVAALKGSYDVENPRIVLDEFQAYMLMEHPTLKALEPLADKHRFLLRKALEDAGTKPYRDRLQGSSPEFALSRQ
ncbi:MAG: hypothetical protein IOD12_09165 [Silvanigrellales bacterium]|nr:hypothetical protein [Silvanigrellales bacterium]